MSLGSCKRNMAGQLATSFGTCKWLLVTFKLLLLVFPLIQCRHVTNFPVHEVVGVGLPEEPLIGLRIDLVRTDSPLSPFSPGNITSTDRLKRAIKRSQDRLQKLQRSVDEVKAVEAPVYAGNGEFLMKMAIGTPSLSFSAILDTGSDLTWTQCKPCSDCYRQPTPIFDPSLSSTYSKVPCSSSLCQALPMYSCSGSNCEYLYTYGDQSSTEGILAYESFTLSSQSLPHIAFGCGQDNEGGGFTQGGGLVGFGRGPLSFISQLGQSVGNKFSYCLVSVTDPPSKTSPLFIGQTASLKAKTFSSTPLVQSRSTPTFYYLSLEGISVGGQLLDIPDGTFDLQFDGNGGVIIDSGTTVTYLEETGYNAVKEAVISSVSLPQVDGSKIGLDLCFDQQSASSTSNFPTITFHFEGADFNLPKENYIYTDASGIACLAMLPSNGMSIFGNIQQQNYQILYDNGRNVLSFAPTVCDTLHVTNFPVHEVVGVGLPEEPLIGLRIDLVRTDSPLSPFSPGNITSTDRLKRAIKRSQDRLQKLQRSVDEVKAVEAPVYAGNGEFLMKMAIGTPSLSFSAILDTGSDLTWTQCKPCSDCYRQPTPIFDPSLSSTYSKVPCSSSLCQALPMYSCSGSNCEYLYTYGDQSSTEGILAYESFTLSSQSLPHIAFGCGQDNEGGGFTQGGGLVGFGRGPLSFISQLGQSVGNKFSYCLVSVTDPPSKTSPLFIGQTASLKAKTFSSTPLVQSRSTPTFYYLSLEGISVGGQLLDIPDGTFDLQFDGNGGVIIDSGTTVTYLQQTGYDAVKEAVISSVSLPQVDGSKIGLDLCFDQQSASSTSNFPTITFHFEGADFNLPKENYIYTDASGIACLAMLPSNGMSIFGNIQQQNYQILYDNGRNVLSFAPTVCDTL